MGPDKFFLRHLQLAHLKIGGIKFPGVLEQGFITLFPDRGQNFCNRLSAARICFLKPVKQLRYNLLPGSAR
jgi:hypothetical protein